MIASTKSEVSIDTRGSGKSPGQSDPGGWQETLDFYDAIEWAAKQKWCSGNIGTSGISYHATTQWRVAGLQPPSLKAIMPWEGYGDAYRDAVFHGGIFQLYYLATWYATQMAHHLLGDPQEYNPDAFHNERLWNYMRHSLDMGYWDNRGAHWDKIKVPVYSAGNWSGHNLHLRGNVEGFVNEWPLKRTQWTKFYLRADRKTPSADALGIEGGLQTAAPKKEGKLTYSATGTSHAGVASASSTMLQAGSMHRTGIGFETGPMQQDTEVTGPVKLVLWVSSTQKDMDIFATIRNIGPDGKDVWEVGQQGQQVPVAKGWLRASHRKLDPERTLPYRPYHAHDERWWLTPGEPVECEVEIWPTGMVFRKGHRICLDIQPRDGIGSAPYSHYPAAYNTGGDNTVHTGGKMASYLMLPIIPPKKR